MSNRSSFVLACTALAFMFASPLNAQLIQQDDIIYGLSLSPDDGQSVQLLRGPAEEFGGDDALQDAYWGEGFVQAVELDNLNGIAHNPEGNLLGVNFGRSSEGGSIFNFSATEDVDVTELIGNTTGLGGDGVTMTRMGGLSVSPGNTKIAVTGYDTAQVLVFDYTAGDTLGSGAALSNARETSYTSLSERDTQGTSWLNDNEVMAFATDGTLLSVDARSMDTRVLAEVNTGGGAEVNRSEYTDLEYIPGVSPYVYASYGAFDRDLSETLNQIFILDPRDSFSLVKTVDLSQSSQTFREIAMDSQANLFITQFRGTIDLLQGVDQPSELEDDSSLDWYESPEGPSFSGIEAAAGVPIPNVDPDGDFNMNGVLDAPDMDLLSVEASAGTNDPAYDLNSDNLVNELDRVFWINDLKKSYFGDANLDGEFNSRDLVVVFTSGKYETGATAGWSEGDWNGDMLFESGDMVTAFTAGGYELGPRAAVAAVPEPSGLILFVLGLLALRVRRR